MNTLENSSITTDLSKRNQDSSKEYVLQTNHLDMVLCVFANENYIFSGGKDGSINIFNEKGLIKSFIAHSSSVLQLFCFDDYLISGGDIGDNSIKVWNLNNYSVIAKF